MKPFENISLKAKAYVVYDAVDNKIISSLNAAESVDFKNDAYYLLTESSPEKCHHLAQILLDKTNFKQQKIQEIVQEIV